MRRLQFTRTDELAVKLNWFDKGQLSRLKVIVPATDSAAPQFPYCGYSFATQQNPASAPL